MDLLQQYKKRGITKHNLTIKKIMLCICSDWCGIIHKSFWKKLKPLAVKYTERSFLCQCCYQSKIWMSSGTRRYSSIKKMLGHMCLHSPVEYCMNSDEIFCRTHYIASTLFLQTSAIFIPAVTSC